MYFEILFRSLGINSLHIYYFIYKKEYVKKYYRDFLFLFFSVCYSFQKISIIITVLVKSINTYLNRRDHVYLKNFYSKTEITY